MVKAAFLGMALLAGAAPAALAHPHVFIDTTLEVIFDAEGRAEALRIGWAYDDLYSLTYLVENGFDPEVDGVLTAEETARLHGFDMNWEEGFPGDTYALQAGQPLALGRPEAFSAALREGRLVSTHLRRFAAPVAMTAPLVVQVYDPSFYTAYTIAAMPVLTGTGGGACTVQVFEPDRAAADARLQAALEELAGSADVELDFPAIGDAYAEEAVVTCAAP
jgi:polyphosphate kinase